MILVFASSFRALDPQNELLVEALKKSGREYCLINPLNLNDLCNLSLIITNGGSKLLLGDRDISPTSIFYSRLWRTDCLLDLPLGCIYPTMFRQKSGIFLEEIDQSFELARRFPGRLDRVRLGESKSAMYKLAYKNGLKVPEMTLSSFNRPQPGHFYRKSLGFPFSISLNQIDREEVAVTVKNKSEKEDDLCGLPWQWQTELVAVKQTRSVVVGRKIWTYSIDSNQLMGEDLREANNRPGSLNWVKEDLPSEIEGKIRSLLKVIGIKYAAPEFLVDRRGQYTLIDLNPCGDWFGFSNDEDGVEIAEQIVAKL